METILTILVTVICTLATQVKVGRVLTFIMVVTVLGAGLALGAGIKNAEGIVFSAIDYVRTMI